jgi:tetratricopeptide (TPR) repeat protein
MCGAYQLLERLRSMKRSSKNSVLVLMLSAGLAMNAAQAPGNPSRVGPPHAKSQQELDDYRAGNAASSGEGLERAAVRFSARYPQSELSQYLLAKAMLQYQAENNPARMLAMGEKVLALDPDHSLALVLTATALADNLGSGDSDRDHQIAEIKRNAGRALETIGSHYVPAAAATPRQTGLYRDTLQSMAHVALGIMRLKTGDYADAEKDLKAAADLSKSKPDPYIWYHLALAQDHRKRYPSALNSVEQALQLASANPDLQKMAETEHERLTRLAGRSRRAPDSGGEPPPQ